MKSNFSIRANLLRLNGAFLRNIKGATCTKKCLIIPVDDNPCLHHGEKGVYLNAIAYELAEPKYEDTHMLKGDYPKAVRETMTDEELRTVPILGNMHPFKNEDKPAPEVKESISGEAFEEDNDDIPF